MKIKYQKFNLSIHNYAHISDTKKQMKPIPYIKKEKDNNNNNNKSLVISLTTE